MKKTFVVLLAAGKGSRMNASVNKVLISLCGKPVIRRSAEALAPFADELVIVSRPEEQGDIFAVLSDAALLCPFRFVNGGETRQESVLNALRSISADHGDIILIHDAARCLVDAGVISRVISSVLQYGTGIPGIPAVNTVKMCDDDSFVIYTPERSSLYEIQTPQGFTAEKIIPFALKAAENHIECTDDAGLLEHYKIPVKVVPGSSLNFKLTEPDDLSRARIILKGDEPPVRIGMGFDVHRLVQGRKLILCGVDIPYELGLLGYSDADVALHALMDAMLGACALGDIGSNFPDSDERFCGISSMILLDETVKILSTAGYQVSNADITIVAQKPKILPWIPDMIRNISSVLSLPENCISIKATTTEKLGFEGRMEGISSYAVCSVTEKNA